MKLIAFTDTHTSKRKFEKLKQLIKKEKPDLLICAGDISIFEQGLDNMLHKIAKIDVDTVLVHGNHESPDLFQKLTQFFDNLKFIHGKIHKHRDALIVGHGGGGFSEVDKEFEEKIDNIIEWLKPKRKNKKVIFVSHAPPYKTKLDKAWNEHNGNKSYRKFIEKAKPDLAVCGHFHEHAGKKDKIGKTIVINPGAEGMVIEL